MKLVAHTSPRHDGTPPAPRLGILVDNEVRAVEDDAPPDLRAVIASGSLPRAAGSSIGLDAVELRPPIPRPGKIVCIGLNDHDHCREQGIEAPAYPMLFAKFATAINGTLENRVRDAQPRIPDHAAAAGLQPIGVAAR